MLPLPSSPGKANLIATLGSGDGGLVLAGHTDTVPYEPGRWSVEPLSLTERDGRLYGLGVADMKGFFAVALEAVRQADRTGRRAPIVLVATADEESTMDGAQALAHAGKPRGKWAIVGEPTGLRPIAMHKGILMESVLLVGRSAHSSVPSLGISALDGMYEVIGGLMQWRAELESRRDPRFPVPYPTLNLGRVHGGDAPNRVCGTCELQVDLRLLPGMDVQVAREQLRERVMHAVRGRGLEVRFAPLVDGNPPFVAREGSQMLEGACAVTGAAPTAVQYCTEAPYFSELGMDTVVLGPADISVAHQPDEYFARDQVEVSVKVFRELIERFHR